MQRTLAMIKPDAVRHKHIGNIIAMYESSGLDLVAAKLARLTHQQAEKLYQQHVGRAFYPDLIDFVCSGPVVLLVLEGENAIERNREIMGATDPAQAAPGTIRQLYAENIDANAVHGSDSSESAERELALFFVPDELTR